MLNSRISIVAERYMFLPLVMMVMVMVLLLTVRSVVAQNVLPEQQRILELSGVNSDGMKLTSAQGVYVSASIPESVHLLEGIGFNFEIEYSNRSDNSVTIRSPKDFIQILLINGEGWPVMPSQPPSSVFVQTPPNVTDDENMCVTLAPNETHRVEMHIPRILSDPEGLSKEKRNSGQGGGQQKSSASPTLVEIAPGKYKIRIMATVVYKQPSNQTNQLLQTDMADVEFLIDSD